MNRRDPAALPGHDALSRLARNNPQSFETLRLELIEDCIDGAPEPIQLRLRQLQFRIDGIRQRSRSPLGATVKIHALMWEYFLGMNDELQELSAQRRSPPLARNQGTGKTKTPRSAQIIEIKARPPKRPHDDRC